MTTTIDNNNNNNNLHGSVASGKFTLVQKFITNGCDPDTPHSISGLRPIHIAASRGHLKLVQYLYEKTHCNADAKDKEGETALLKAAYAGHLTVVKYLIEKAGANYLHEDSDGWTALHNACSCGNLPLVRFLLSQPDVNVDVKSKQGHTPLMNAASKGFIDIVVCLIEKNHANPRLKNNFNETAYDVAAASGEVYLCQLLEQYERQQQQQQDNYNVLDLHVTVPVILVEEVSQDGSTQWLLNGTRVMNKSRVELPNTSWFWLSDWMIDYSFPKYRMEETGWFYYQNTHWSLPIISSSNTATNSWIKRRRWIRIMKKVMDIHHEQQHDYTTLDHDNDTPQDPVGKSFESKTRTSVSTTMTKAESIFIGCSTLPEPLLQEQMVNNQIEIIPQEEEEEEIPVSWERNDQALDCRRCHRVFNFIVRKHHCRKCGQVICDRCSSHRALLPFHQIIQPPNIPIDDLYVLSLQPQRVCDHCVDTVAFENSQAVNKRTSSVMLECPVCSRDLMEFETNQEQEQHVQECLSNGYNHQSSSNSVNNGVRYVVYKLAENSALIGQECIICFEEFKKDDTVTRLNCMCSYHGHCISGWFSKGKDCPVHSQ